MHLQENLQTIQCNAFKKTKEYFKDPVDLWLTQTQPDSLCKFKDSAETSTIYKEIKQSEWNQNYSDPLFEFAQIVKYLFLFALSCILILFFLSETQ